MIRTFWNIIRVPSPVVFVAFGYLLVGIVSFYSHEVFSANASFLLLLPPAIPLLFGILVGAADLAGRRRNFESALAIILAVPVGLALVNLWLTKCVMMQVYG